MCLVAIGSRDDATRNKLHQNFIQPFVSKAHTAASSSDDNASNIAAGKKHSNQHSAAASSKFANFRASDWKSQQFILPDPEDSSQYFRWIYF